MKNEAHYEHPVNLYISKSYDDAETAQNFIKSLAGEQLTVSKSRNGDYLYVSIEGSDEDIDAFLDVYKDTFTDIVWDCDADANGWVKPKDVYDSIGQDGKVLPEEFKVGEGRSNEDYLQEVWDSLAVAWDKDKFNMGKGYDSEYECECITITSKDNEEVRAKIYVEDYNGRHPAAFNVVYRYPGDKGVGVMGTYEFQSTDMDGLGEEVFDYFDEIKQKVGESMKNENGDKADVYTIDLTRISSDGYEEGIDDMQAAQIFYDEADAIKTAKELADSYKDDDDVVQVTVLAGQYETPRGILGEPFDIFTASSSNSMTTAEYRKKANYVKTTGLDYYANGGKSEGNDDGKGCKGKDCKDDKTKKNEADTTFKVGDFVNYDAASDGKADLLNPMVYAEVSSVNDDGTLDLWVRDYDDGGKEVKGADTQFCDKLDHFAGMTDADHYYTGGRLNLYAGYYEIFITDKKLGKPYVFSGTIDDLGEKDAVDIYYDTISFVDKSLEDECRDWYWYDEDDPEGSKVIDMSDMVNPVEFKKSEGLPPKKLGSNRQYRSRADLINKMKALGAVEITTPAQFNDIHSKQWLHTAGYAMDINGNLIGQTYFGDKDGKWYYATTKTFQGDYLPECKEAKKSEAEGLLDELIDKVDNMFHYHNKNLNNYQYNTIDDLLEALKSKDTDKIKAAISNLDNLVHYRNKNLTKSQYYMLDELLEALQKKYKKSEESKKSEDASSIDDLLARHNQKWLVKVSYDVDASHSAVAPSIVRADTKDAATNIALKQHRGLGYNMKVVSVEPMNEAHKKSESLTLKQKELKDMARYGEAEDITTISDAEAKELKKKGIETVGISRGVYGMNGALLRDNEGNKYVITARSSNLFYFV